MQTSDIMTLSEGLPDISPVERATVSGLGGLSDAPAVSGLSQRLADPAVSGLSQLPPGLDSETTTIPETLIFGGEGDERLALQGGTAFGGGGSDVYVLSRQGLDAPERLGVVLDFQPGDSLDVSGLGATAAILTRGALDAGGERIGFDYDGDGDEDGYVLLLTGLGGLAFPVEPDGGPGDTPMPVEPDGGFGGAIELSLSSGFGLSGWNF